MRHLAPEGRHVAPGYGRHENWNVSNRSCMRRGWVPQPVGRGNLSPTIDTASPIVSHLAPEGRHVYGRHENWNVSNRSWIRRGWVPQPVGRGNLAPTMDTAPPILPHLPPEGRQVAPGYGRHENWNVSNRSCIRRGWVPQPIGRGNLSPTIDTAPPIVSHLAPEGRHVPPRYGRHENWNVSNRSCIRRGWVPQPARARKPLPHDRYRAANSAAFSPRGAACPTRIREARKLEREQPKLHP